MDFKSKSVMKASIIDLAIYLPEQLVENEEVESMVSYNENTKLSSGVLKKMFGNDTRHYASAEMQVSDLAYFAAKKILDRNKVAIDLLIFAAASSDLIEPATSNIVQSKLGIVCAAMDIKNACNSVTSAIQTASAYISSGIYKNVLIVNGEKLSEVINFNPKDEAHLIKCLAGYSLGDAGAAILMSHTLGSTLEFQKICNWGNYWDLCTVKGGGSLAFREADKYFFEGNAKALKETMLLKGVEFVNTCIVESGYSKSDFDCIITHQISYNMPFTIANAAGLDTTKCINTFNKYGNTAAASIPLAIQEALDTDKLKKGDILLLIGLAAGISISVQILKW
jgi:acyl-CoA:acyl-CoA alkyltransferase